MWKARTVAISKYSQTSIIKHYCIDSELTESPPVVLTTFLSPSGPDFPFIALMRRLLVVAWCLVAGGWSRLLFLLSNPSGLWCLRQGWARGNGNWPWDGLLLFRMQMGGKYQRLPSQSEPQGGDERGGFGYNAIGFWILLMIWGISPRIVVSYMSCKMLQQD